MSLLLLPITAKWSKETSEKGTVHFFDLITNWTLFFLRFKIIFLLTEAFYKKSIFELFKYDHKSKCLKIKLFMLSRVMIRLWGLKYPDFPQNF